MTYFPERRRSDRYPVRSHGWIIIAGRPRLSCVARDMSELGAFLVLEPPSWLPFRFKLQLEGQRAAYTCEIRHCRSTGIGVTFVEASAVTARAKTLWRQTLEGDDWKANSGDATSAAAKPNCRSPRA